MPCWASRSEARDADRAGARDHGLGAETRGALAWPEQIFVELRQLTREAPLDGGVTSLGKIGTRLPEPIWLSFKPVRILSHRWQLDK